MNKNDRKMVKSLSAQCIDLAERIEDLRATVRSMSGARPVEGVSESSSPDHDKPGLS